RERMRVGAGGITSFDLSADGKSVLVALSGKVYVAPLAGGEPVQVAASDEQGRPPFDARFSPDGRQGAFVRGGDLWGGAAAGGEPRQLTRGAGPDISHAQAEFVAQEEMDRFAGYWWAPESDALVYEIADATQVERYWGADAADPMTPAPPPPYPRPGH